MRPSDCPLPQASRRGPLVGPHIYSDSLVHVSHRATGPLGYVFIETVRHVPHVDGLTPEEAAAIGRVRSRVASELDIDFVHAMVVGTGVAHVHEHVFARHSGTPSDPAWWQSWSDSPQGDVTDLARRLGSYVDGGPSE